MSNISILDNIEAIVALKNEGTEKTAEIYNLNILNPNIFYILRSNIARKRKKSAL